MQKESILTEIQNITRQIVQNYNPLKIILFGSAGRGDYAHADDLDFIVIKDDVPQRGLDRMRELDTFVVTQMPADFLVYRSDEFEERVRLGDPFVVTILKEGQVLYG